MVAVRVTLALSGIATSGVVLSTLRQAADLDDELTVLRDGCADADLEVHRLLLDKVFPRQAAIIDTVAWLEGVDRTGSAAADPPFSQAALRRDQAGTQPQGEQP